MSTLNMALLSMILRVAHIPKLQSNMYAASCRIYIIHSLSWLCRDTLASGIIDLQPQLSAPGTWKDDPSGVPVGASGKAEALPKQRRCRWGAALLHGPFGGSCFWDAPTTWRPLSLVTAPR